MHDAWLLSAALLSNVAGLAWLAFAMEAHWRQVHPSQPLATRRVRMLRTLGVVALSASLVLCLRVDHVSMALLVWVMSLAAAALIVTFALAWRPHWLAKLVLARQWPSQRLNCSVDGAVGSGRRDSRLQGLTRGPSRDG